MNFIKLEILILISKYNKVTTVAERLGIKQPTVTFHMKSLEKLMNTTLFQNQGGYMILTESGEALLHYANKIIRLKEEAERAMDEFNTLKIGTLKIGASYVPSTYLIPEILKNMKNNYFQLQISITAIPSSKIIQMILDHELDAGIICSTGIDNLNIVYKKIYQDELGVVFSSESSLPKEGALTEELLLGQTFVHHSKDSSTRQLVEKWLKKRKMHFNSIVQLDSLEAIKRTLISTNWISIISKKAVEKEIKSGELIYKALPVENIERDIYLIYNKDRWISPMMKKFFQIATDSQWIK